MRVLIAEDDPIWRTSIETLLYKWGYEVEAVENGHDALRHLESDDPPRLAILDWVMPGMDGIEVCRRIRTRQGPYTYVLLLTARDRRADIIAGLEAGADDYVTKPFDAHELKVRLRAGQRIVDLQEALLKAQEDLRIQAAHDPLTGLLNHGAIVEVLQRELSRAEREDRCLGIILGDLDNFKRINDTHGHLAGDAVLREAARRLLGEARAYDAIGRYGGEEFLVVMPGEDADGAVHLAERILGAIGGSDMEIPEGRVRVTISLGVMVKPNGVRLSPDAAIKAADNALYRAKELGRDRIVLADV